MPVVDREKERAIVQRGRERGMSDQQIKNAVVNFRVQNGGVNQSVATSQPTVQSPQAPTKPQEGFFKGLIKAPARALGAVAGTVEALGSLGGAGLSALAGNRQGSQDLMRQANQAIREGGFVGRATGVKPIGANDESFGEIAKQVVGTGLELGSYATPYGLGKGVASALKTGAKIPIKNLAVAGGVASGLGETGASLSEGKSVGQSLARGVSAIPGGAVTGAALPFAGRALGSLTRGVGRGLGNVGRFSASQISGLAPDTVTAATRGELTRNAVNQTPQSYGDTLVNKIKNAFTGRADELSETGKVYNEVRQNVVPLKIKRTVSGYHDFVVRELQKQGLKVGKGGVITTTERSKLNPQDVAKIQSFLNQYAKSASVDGTVFLNIRQGLDNLGQWNKLAGETPALADLARNLRRDYDKIGKLAFKGLEKADKQFSTEKPFLNKIRAMLYESADAERRGEVRGGAYSDIANLLNASKTDKRNRLEKLIPGITEEVNILKSLEDIYRTEGQKAGTYTRSALSGGVGGAALLTGNIPALVGAILYGAYGSPQNFVRLFRAFGQGKNAIEKLAINNAIVRILTGKALTSEQKLLLMQFLQGAEMAAQRELTSGLTEKTSTEQPQQ